jgi:hypothetical protein
MSKLLDLFGEALKGDPSRGLPTKEQIAAFAAEKIATHPAMSQRLMEAVILDALEESEVIERHRDAEQRGLLD